MSIASPKEPLEEVLAEKDRTKKTLLWCLLVGFWTSSLILLLLSEEGWARVGFLVSNLAVLLVTRRLLYRNRLNR
jgi:hypothetical protein